VADLGHAVPSAVNFTHSGSGSSRSSTHSRSCGRHVKLNISAWTQRRSDGACTTRFWVGIMAMGLFLVHHRLSTVFAIWTRLKRAHFLNR